MKRKMAEGGHFEDESSAKKQRPLGETLSPETRVLMVQAIVSCLEESGARGECFLEGSKLSTALTSVPETKALVDETRASFGGKGWLRRLLCTEPQVVQVRVTGKDEPCFQLAEGSELIPYFDPEDSAELRDPALKLDPVIKEVIPAPDDVAPVSDTLQEGVTMLIRIALTTLQQAKEEAEDFVEGNRISKVLHLEAADLVPAVRDALGKKGWLKKLFAREPAIEQVLVQGKDEPCFRLSDFPPMPEHVGPSEPSDVSNVAKALARSKKPAVASSAGKGSGKAASAQSRTMQQAEQGWPGKAGKGAAAFGGFGGYDPFGFLNYGGKAAFQAMWEAKGKAAFAGAYGKAGAWPPMWGMPGGGGGGPPGKSGGAASASGGKGSQGSYSANPGGGKGANSGGGKAAGAKGSAAAPAKSLTLSDADSWSAQRVLQVVIETLQQHWDSDGWMEGNRLRKAAMEVDPESVNKVKASLNGKGWLKKLLASEPTIECGQLAGKDEPCYRMRPPS